MIKEIRIYKLKPNVADEFNKVFTEQVLPMLNRWKVNVVFFGASLEDQDTFLLVRGYQNIEERQSQDAFYGSDEWKNGPREAVMNCIETYNTAVVDNIKLT